MSSLDELTAKVGGHANKQQVNYKRLKQAGATSPEARGACQWNDARIAVLIEELKQRKEEQIS